MKIYTDELKIGNYIAENDKLVIVYEISNEMINGKSINTGVFKPILLTEEILEWFGFYKNDKSFYKGKISLNLNLNGCVYYNKELICGNSICLHHLQNIWFSLTLTNLILKKIIMTPKEKELFEKFSDHVDSHSYTEWSTTENAKFCVKIADEYAVNFAYWLTDSENKNVKGRITIEELIEIYKKTKL